MYGSVGTLAEDNKFEENSGCGVGTRHSGQYKMVHRKCLLAENTCRIRGDRS